MQTSVDSLVPVAPQHIIDVEDIIGILVVISIVSCRLARLREHSPWVKGELVAECRVDEVIRLRQLGRQGFQGLLLLVTRSHTILQHLDGRNSKLQEQRGGETYADTAAFRIGSPSLESRLRALAVVVFPHSPESAARTARAPLLAVL